MCVFAWANISAHKLLPSENSRNKNKRVGLALVKLDKKQVKGAKNWVTNEYSHKNYKYLYIYIQTYTHTHAHRHILSKLSFGRVCLLVFVVVTSSSSLSSKVQVWLLSLVANTCYCALIFLSLWQTSTFEDKSTWEQTVERWRWCEQHECCEWKQHYR